MAKRPLDDAEEVEVTSRAALRDWLAAHHGRERGVWLVTWKKAHADRYVSTGEIVRECLAFGWVDSLTRGKDADRSMLWISPRKPGSNWSRVNKALMAELEAEGLMTEAGRATVARARADGTWTALDDVENLVVPPDLQAAFDGAPGTETVWQDYPRSVKRAALEQLLNAKRPATREKRIVAILEAARAGERPFQWRA
ncbi:YdeI/OmpD-associated family protein [Histidinibacterium aquaticum]|uniref:YdeI/OmpD-associated family protein n=1 Tax=Histidinibacterium aquaticum TaxID=2613962 RepID=A0A5J5GPM0_9RHOB|nr:YdeI/OmpD-associated family protein [Histidinibacterium aquaticum]KAA9010326.1 hypothetical protein F3S47_03510 [Histidinibacterium aquaticum]